jgi:hypothetical protein
MAFNAASLSALSMALLKLALSTRPVSTPSSLSLPSWSISVWVSLIALRDAAAIFPRSTSYSRPARLIASVRTASVNCARRCASRLLPRNAVRALASNTAKSLPDKALAQAASVSLAVIFAVSPSLSRVAAKSLMP